MPFEKGTVRYLSGKYFTKSILSGKLRIWLISSFVRYGWEDAINYFNQRYFLWKYISSSSHLRVILRLAQLEPSDYQEAEDGLFEQAYQMVADACKYVKNVTDVKTRFLYANFIQSVFDKIFIGDWGDPGRLENVDCETQAKFELFDARGEVKTILFQWFQPSEWNLPQLE